MSGEERLPGATQKLWTPHRSISSTAASAHARFRFGAELNGGIDTRSLANWRALVSRNHHTTGPGDGELS